MSMHAREPIGAVRCAECGLVLRVNTSTPGVQITCMYDGCAGLIADESAHKATRGENSRARSNAATLPLQFSPEPSGGVAENCGAENFEGPNLATEFGADHVVAGKVGG